MIIALNGLAYKSDAPCKGILFPYPGRHFASGIFLIVFYHDTTDDNIVAHVPHIPSHNLDPGIPKNRH